MIRILEILRRRNFCSVVALVITLVGLVSTAFWQPSPNRVHVPLIDNDEQTFLQVYYRYGFPGPGSFFEYYSDLEFLHRSDDTLVADFELPGWRKLRAIRLDFGRNIVRDFKLGPVVFGYESMHRFYPLFELDGAEVLKRWQPNDQISSGVITDNSWTVHATDEDAYLVIPVSGEDWLGKLSNDTLWMLRGIRLIYFALAAGLIFLVGRLLRSGWLIRAGGSETTLWNRNWWVVFLLFVGTLGYFVYEPYLTFQRLYLFKDVAMDSVDVFWPIYMHISDYFRTEGYPLWSFSIGAGQGLFNWIGDPFLFILYAMSPPDVGLALGWVQFLKTIVAAIFFLGWLRLLGLGRYASAIATVGLVFSAHMVIRGNWTHYATEVVMVAFALFAFECFLHRKIWHLLPLAILFLVIRGVYHTYVWSLLFFGYALLRIWIEAGWKPKWIGAQILKLGGCYILGIGLSAVLLFPNLYEIFSSPRVSGSESGILEFAQSTPFSVNDTQEWLSSLYGLFAPDILGRGVFYSGWRNYLEGPHLYAGTLMFLLFPQAFIGRSRRVRTVLCIALVASLLYIFVPYARYFLNAFAGTYYKTSSFWITVIVAGFGAIALDNLVRRRKFSLRVLAVTLVVYLLALWLVRHSEFIIELVRVKESYRTYKQVIILLFAYSGALFLMRGAKTRQYGLFLLPLLLSWEVVQFAGQVSQDRLVLRADSVETGAFYFDDSYSAIEMIKQSDSSFYRVEKQELSTSLNDPLGQGYHGLTSYYSFNAGGYLAFLGKEGFDTEYLDHGLGSSYVKGPGNRIALATLLSTKYFLAREKNKKEPPPHYSAWGRAGNVLIYENDCFVPFGVVYSEWISEDRMRELPPAVRDLVAFAAATIPIQTAEVLQDVSEISDEKISSIQTAEVTGEWDETYRSLAKTLATTSVQWSELGQNRMRGQVSLNQSGIAYFSIPNNEGWAAELNGQTVDLFPVHFGFVGLELPPGNHEILLTYFPPYMKAGMFFSGLSVLILLGFLLGAVRRRSR